VVEVIENYGKNLFQKLFTDRALFRFRKAIQDAGPQNIIIEIVGDSPNFQAIFWESLRDPTQGDPLAALGTSFIRKNVKSFNVETNVQQSPTINLLIVTARPNEESDVNYRTIQRPLIDLIEESSTPIKAFILRPGTYKALIKHLYNKAGYYHIIHFDLHGSLLDYPAYQALQKIGENSPSRQVRLTRQYGIKEINEEDFNGGQKAFIFFESEEKGIPVAVDAIQLGNLLEEKQIPICILNACQSAKQDNSAHETSLGRILIKKGIQSVLAMRYSISVTAVRLMMKKLYDQVYQLKFFDQAVASARQELYRNKKRRATYNYDIALEDWLLPVLYQNGKSVLNIKITDAEEKENFLNQQVPEDLQQKLPYGFFGRDLDILKIEKNLTVRSNILLLQGMGGAGKTTLLKYLSVWWLHTGFIDRVFYFGYDIRAYTLSEIVYHIAQKIFSKEDYSAFTAKPPAIQEKNIITAFKTNRYALILDNTESITGARLAIPHTLSEEEQKALKNFLSQLKAGESVVIVGSRASEDWLKRGTFENNSYVLKGLDPESAISFSSEILKSINVSVESVMIDENFSRLIKLMAGYPLALKAILPNLNKKTPKLIVEELEQGIGDLDKGNIQEKTESIIKCIEYAHSNLSKDAQQLLLCLAPFQTVVNLSIEFIDIYFEKLKEEEHFKNYPFGKLEEVVKEAERNGLMQTSIPTFPLRLMNLQPTFTFFLKNRFREENEFLQTSLENAFITYYNTISRTIIDLLNSTESIPQKVGMLVMKYEYENFYHALRLSLNQEKGILDIHGVMDEYLDKSLLQQKRLELVEMVNDRVEKYSLQNLTPEGYYYETGKIKFRLAIVYQKLRKSDRAEQTYKEVLNILTKHAAVINDKTLIANVYQNFGVFLQDQKNFTDSLYYYEKALAMFVEYGDIIKQARMFHHLGALSQEQNEFSDAKSYYQKAQAIYEENNDLIRLGRVYQNLGAISGQQNDFNSSKKYFESALNIYAHFQDGYSQGRIYYNLGSLSSTHNRFLEARQYFEKALNLFVKYQDKERQAQVYNGLGILSEKQKDIPTSIAYFKKASAILREVP
jgi:Tfp pilus assembly protein PilF